jgi:transposase
LRATASAHDVGVDSLRAWIAAYEANGKAGLVAKRRVIYDLDFKLEVLRRMQDEGLSCRQVAALFNIRRLDLVAEWSRLYAAHGAAALQPGWKWEQTRMSKPPSRHDDREAVTNDQASAFEPSSSSTGTSSGNSCGTTWKSNGFAWQPRKQR